MSASAQTRFHIWQNHLANSLGIAEEELRKHRSRLLQEGTDFQKTGARILYSDAGAAKVQAALAAPSMTQPPPVTHSKKTPAPAPVAEENGGLSSVPEAPVITLQVWRSWPLIKNRHILEAFRPGTDPKNRKNILRVRVSDNRNFLRGFDFPARLVQAPDLYECTRRAPRSRGRW